MNVFASGVKRDMVSFFKTCARFYYCCIYVRILVIFWFGVCDFGEENF